MRAVVKYIVAKTYKPLLVRYLSKTRWYSYKGINLEIPPGVFHPGFFFSTKFLLQYISRQELKEKTVLELGAGSGLISLYAARQGAFVTATDINPEAIKYLKVNSQINEVEVEIIRSDLFANLPQKPFNLILINPPYYKKNPSSYAEYAWYCGEKGEYFQTLFANLKYYIHQQSKVYMVLCDGCDMEMIHAEAGKNFFRMKCVNTKKTMLEMNYIFKIEQT